MACHIVPSNLDYNGLQRITTDYDGLHTSQGDVRVRVGVGGWGYAWGLLVEYTKSVPSIFLDD